MAGPGPLRAGQDREGLVVEVAAALDGVPSAATAVVAVSGGPDSTAMAYLVAEARVDLDLRLVLIRHGARDDAEDRAVVATHASWLGLALVERDVAPRGDGHGPQAAARDARYAELRAVADEVGAAVVLVGHTADDQAETVLQRAARGTGIDGLAAMAPVTGESGAPRARGESGAPRARGESGAPRARGDLVRPLLGLRRADLRRFVMLEGLPWVADPTNRDPATARAVVRHQVLPALGSATRDPVGALARLSELARDDAVALAAWAEMVMPAVVRRVGEVVVLDDHQLRALPTAVASRVVRAALAGLRPGPPPAARAIRAVLELAPGQRVDLPGRVRASAGGGWRALAPHRLPTAPVTPLVVPGVTPWPPAGIELRVTTPAESAAPDEVASADPAAAQIALTLDGACLHGRGEPQCLHGRGEPQWSPPAPAIDPATLPPGGADRHARLVLPADIGPLRVRHRQDGDRVRLPAGRRRLAKVLVDAGVPHPVREVWPVVVDADDRVRFVPGLTADAPTVAGGRRDPAAVVWLADGL